MSANPSLPPDDEIIAAARQHAEDVRQRSVGTTCIMTGFPLLQDGRPVAWVKYTGEPENLVEEANTQEYIYEVLNQHPALLESVRVPKVYRIIETDVSIRKVSEFIGHPVTWVVLVVMEYIHGQTVRRCLQRETTDERRIDLWGQVLRALTTLLEFQPPPDTPPGPAGGGVITHLIFGNYAEPEMGPKDFDSAEDFGNYINEILDVPGLFEMEDLKLCYCDPHQANFMVPDDGGSIYLVDFGHCFWLPPSLMRWALWRNFRDEIFPYLRENLQALQHLSEKNHRALTQFNGDYLRREKYY